VFSIAAGFPVASATIRIHFHEETAPDDSDIDCFHIKETAVRTIGFESELNSGKKVVVVKLSHFYLSSFRIQWSNRKLDDYKQHRTVGYR
jgi:hypothetical protein